MLIVRREYIGYMMKNLEWEDKYSVGVKLIDDQHKKMFSTINELIAILSTKPSQEQVSEIIKSLIEYKKYHFATEEKYFDEFNYEGAKEHKEKHKLFSERLEKMIEENKGDSVALAFQLVDFLEDWLIEHLMVVDRKYIPCFKEHGLK